MKLFNRDYGDALTRDEVRERILREVPCTDFLTKAPHGGYVCIYCGSGTGKKGTGAVKYYPSTNTCACFACSDVDQQGRKFDVIDCMTKYYNCDYNEALRIGAERLGVDVMNGKRIDEGWKQHKAATGRENAPADVQQEQGDQIPAEQPKTDFTAYYEACRARLNDPAAVAYLEGRGISMETANKHWMGFDPQADPASAPGAMGDEYKPHPAPRIIIPCTKDYYIARSIDTETPEAFKAPNPKGSSPRLFNWRALYGDNECVFVVEGWADALSFEEIGKAAVATNSKGNGKLLLEQLKAKPTTAILIICHDNEDNTEQAAKTVKQAGELCAKLRTAGARAIVYNVAGAYHDANDALQGDVIGFMNRANDAIIAARDAAEKDDGQTTDATDQNEQGQAETKETEKKGLLTTERARRILEEVDDEFLQMANFPELSTILKVRTHDTVVIAADTGAGKSSLSLNFLHDLHEKYPVLYFNLEMDEATVIQRLVSIHTGMELDRIEGYKNDPTTRKEVDGAIEKIVAGREIRLLTDVYDLTEIEQQIKEATTGRTEPTIVFVDTALLIHIANKGASRYERFTHISEELRRISRLNNIIMFALLQQNREGKKDEKKPANSSLKESGSWENDATKIMFLWFNPETGKKELVITKNRNGKTGDLTLNYEPHTQTYREPPTPWDEDGTKQPEQKKDKPIVKRL